MNATLIGSVLAVVLTLMVFSYLLGNNPLYRLAQHIFVGVSVGYAALLLLGNVLIPRIWIVQNSGGLSGWLAGVPILFGLLLLFRLVGPARRGLWRLPLGLATLVLNLAVSTAAALTIGGVLTGTLIPQVVNTMRPVGADLPALVGNLVVVLGVIACLYYFRFSVRPDGTRAASSALVAGAGRWLILVALGATLGTLSVSFVSALVDRVAFVLTQLGTWLGFS